MSINISNLMHNSYHKKDLPWVEFQQNILRWVLFACGLPSILWQLFEDNPWMIMVCLTTMVLVTWLIGKNIYLASVTLFAGFSAFFIGLAAIDQLPMIIMLLCLLPFIMGICFGITGGGLSLLVLIVEVEWISYQLPNSVLVHYTSPIIIGGVVLLSLGLLVRYCMITLVSPYYENYHRIIHELNNARQEQVELKQVQEDLIHANNEKARLTKQLKVLYQVAEEARVAKENFVAMVSHELRTPLNMIIGFSEVITQSPRIYGIKLPSTLLADITSIQRNSQHLLELVNDVLDLSQVDMGNLAIAREWCAIQEIVTEAFDVILPLFSTKGLYLRADLPNCHSEHEQNIYCDKTRVREILINLLSNSGRFTEQGGVSVRAHFENNLLIVAVEDTGPGISPGNQAKLFEPFQQLDNSIHRQYGGSGLGLTISKRFVEMHGGRMWLESEVGRGTTFFFSLPVNFTEVQNFTSTASRWINPYAIRYPRVRSSKFNLEAPKPRCIVLEEGQTVQHLLSRYLDKIDVLPVQGIDEAVETVTQFPSQLMIINHHQATSLLDSTTSQDKLPFGLPVLAFWMPTEKYYSETIGANRYLVKPVSKETLLEAIAEFGEKVKQILLVDDNPEIVQLFGRILSSSDRSYQILRAFDGEQALKILRSRKPDLMILDLIMPEVNGFQVLKEKASDAEIRDIPVVVISAQDHTGLPKVSQSVTIARGGGFSSRDLLELVESLVFRGEITSQTVKAT